MNAVNRLEELKKLGELLESGVVSKEEFEAEKTRLINLNDVSVDLDDSLVNDRYIPGSAINAAELPENELVTKAAGIGLKKFAIVVFRIWLIFPTLGISELVIFLYKRYKASH
jgi:hypothetical protein